MKCQKCNIVGLLWPDNPPGPQAKPTHIYTAESSMRHCEFGLKIFVLKKIYIYSLFRTSKSNNVRFFPIALLSSRNSCLR